jgi:hypothetical protein
MVYAEDKLQRKVDWRTIKTFKKSLMKAPESIDIPRERKFQGQGGLSKSKNEEEPIPDACVEWSADSDVDLKSGCSREERDKMMDTLRDAEVGRFVDELLDANELEVGDFSIGEIGASSSASGLSFHPSIPYDQLLANLDMWDQDSREDVQEKIKINPPLFNEGFLTSLGKDKSMCIPSDETLLKKIKDLETQLWEQQENHDLQIQKLLSDFSIKEEAYKKKIEDLQLNRGSY